MDIWDYKCYWLKYKELAKPHTCIKIPHLLQFLVAFLISATETISQSLELQPCNSPVVHFLLSQCAFIGFALNIG